MQNRVAIVTASTEQEAETTRIKLLDLGVRSAWTAYCELISMWTVVVNEEEARGAYVRLQSLTV